MAEILYSNGGWVEVLFRQDPSALFRNLAELKQEHYEMVGSPVPIRELTMIYDMVLMLQENRFGGLPRPLQHGDALQIVTGAPDVRTRCYVVVDVHKMKATMEKGYYRMEIIPGHTLGLLQHPERFPSFHARRHTQS